MQLFEGAAPAFNFGSIASHMQFGPVAAAFGEGQQQQFGPGGGVDWSSPAPSPPPILSVGPAAVFGPGAGMPLDLHLQHHLGRQQQQQQQYGGGYGAPPGLHRPPPPPMEDPAAALPDDVFDMPSHAALQQHRAEMGGGQANGHPRGQRGYGNRSRGRGPRYQQQQQQHPPHHMQHGGGYAMQHMGYPPAGGPGYPPHQMPGWPSQAPHFLPPQLVGARQQQGGGGERGRGGRGRNGGGGHRSNAGRQHKQQQRAEQ